MFIKKFPVLHNFFLMACPFSQVQIGLIGCLKALNYPTWNQKFLIEQIQMIIMSHWRKKV